MSLFHSKNLSKSANSTSSAKAPRSGSGLLPAALLAAAGMLALTPAANAGGSFSIGFSFGSSFRDGCDPCVPSWWSSPSYSSSVVISNGVDCYDPCGWNSWTPVYTRPVFVSTFVSRPICSPVFDPCFPSYWTGYSHWHRPFCAPVVVAPVFPVYSCDFVPSYTIPGPCDGFYSTYSSSAYFSRSSISFGFFFGSTNHWRSNWRRDCVVVRPLPPVCGPVVRHRGPIGQPNQGFIVGQQPVVMGPMPIRIPDQPVVVPSAAKPATFVSGPSPSGPAQPNFGKPETKPAVATQPFVASKPPVPAKPVAVNPVIRESTGKPVAFNGNPGVVPGKVPTAPVASKPQTQPQTKPQTKPQIPSQVEPMKPQAPSKPQAPTGPTTQPAKPQVQPAKQPQTQPLDQPSKPSRGPAMGPVMGPAQAKPAPSPNVGTPAQSPSPAPQFRPFVAPKPAAQAPTDSGLNKQPSAIQSPSQGFTAQPAPSRQMSKPSSPAFVAPQGQLGQRERLPGASPSTSPAKAPAPAQRQAPSFAKPSAGPSPAPAAAPAPAMRQPSGPSPMNNGGGNAGQGGGFGGGPTVGQGGGSGKNK